MAALPGDGAAAGDVNGPAQLDLDGAAPVGARSFAPHQAHPAEALDIGIPEQRSAECAPALEACVAAAVEGDPACTLHLNCAAPTRTPPVRPPHVQGVPASEPAHDK